MKKKLLLLFIPFMFACSGSDDNDSLSLTESAITLNYQGTYQIKASSEKSLSYSTEDEYHATVSSSGLVTANKVGETNIIVSDGSTTKKLNVIVTPKSTLYNEPLTDWTLTKSQIISKLGTPDQTSDNSILYQTSNTSVPYVIYLFADNGTYESSAVFVKSAFSSTLGTFLVERYIYGTTIESSYTLVFTNASSLAKTTMFIGAMLYNTSYWIVSYMPYSATKSKKIINSRLVFQELSKYGIQ